MVVVSLVVEFLLVCHGSGESSSTVLAVVSW